MPRPILKLKRGHVRVARSLLPREVFDQWISGSGRMTYNKTLNDTPARWFFGAARARRKLFSGARRFLTARSTFADKLGVELNTVADLAARLALTLRKRGLTDLYTVHDERTLVVVPRAVVLRFLEQKLVAELGRTRELMTYPGLAECVLSYVAMEAETLISGDIAGGRSYVEARGRGALVGADLTFPWRIDNTDGHYIIAWSSDENQLLNDNRALRKFRSQLKDALHAQAVYLTRLNAMQRNTIVDALGFQQVGSPQAGGTPVGSAF